MTGQTGQAIQTGQLVLEKTGQSIGLDVLLSIGYCNLTVCVLFICFPCISCKICDSLNSRKIQFSADRTRAFIYWLVRLARHVLDWPLLFRLLQKPDTPGLWVKCRTAELECGRYAEWKMRNDGDWSTGQTTWPHRSYYAVYHTLHVAGAAANCVMQTWKVAFCACYDTLAFAAKCVSLKHTHMKTNYYNNTKR